ncbi:hypothetical protein P0934_09565 [Klebsiella pneumoniae]|nr:hypothetical protein P0934_09565 [Klebsiella pneumoniae]
MNELQHQGAELRNKAKELALSVLRTHPDGQKTVKGLNKLKYFALVA